MNDHAAYKQEAADQGNAFAQTELGVAYHNGHGVARNDPAALSWIQKAANQGLALAEFNLGATYVNEGGQAVIGNVKKPTVLSLTKQ